MTTETKEFVMSVDNIELKTKIIKRNKLARKIIQKLFEHQFDVPNPLKASAFITSTYEDANYVEELNHLRMTLGFLCFKGDIMMRKIDGGSWTTGSLQPNDVVLELPAGIILALQYETLGVEGYCGDQTWFERNFPV
jgi:hypothetical protein